MKLDKIYPLTFEPIFKAYVWGGKKLISIKKAFSYEKIAESWEVTDREEGQSKIAGGVYQGKVLHEILGEDLLGKNKKERQFPLLIKLIDSQENLSIQVHPDDSSASFLKAEPKTEAWYILQAEPGAAVYAGLKEEISEACLKKYIGTSQILSYLRKIPVKKGDIIFIPGGRIHAILKGCFLLEVQQNSNTTYRVYDWDRKDAKRPLHLKESLQVIQRKDIEDPRQKPWKIEESEACQRYGCLHTPWFQLQRWRIQGRVVKDLANYFHLFFLIEGKAWLYLEEEKTPMELLRAYLIPAKAKEISFEGEAILLCVTHK